MNCEICAQDSSTDSVMWACVGCQRKFHATCVGVSVQRNSLRKRDKTIDITSYVLPCCSACQNLVTASLEFNVLVEQQERLVEHINKNTEVLHRLTLQQEKPSIVHETLEGLEILLTGMKNELSTMNKSCSLAGSVAAIKNHVTSVFDTAIQANNERLSNSLKTVTSELAVDLRNINNEICQLNQLTLETAATSTMNSNPMLGLDILDELKSLSANLMTAQNTAHSTLPSDPYPSLEIEMSGNKKDASGWRFLGTRQVWKADWSNYDARQLRRAEQQKKADKARKKRQHAKNRNLNYARMENTQSNVFTGYKQPNNCRGTCEGRFNIMSNYNNNNTLNPDSRNRYLPSDRELLAAAKDHFSTPPSTYRPTMRFERGEILNPYPADVPPRNPARWTPSVEVCCTRPSFRPY